MRLPFLKSEAIAAPGKLLVAYVEKGVRSCGIVALSKVLYAHFTSIEFVTMGFFLVLALCFINILVVV